VSGELKALRREFETLANELAAASTALKGKGSPPPTDLCRRIEAALTNFGTLKLAYQPHSSQELKDLEGIEALLLELEGKKVAEARSVLERGLQVAVVGDATAPVTLGNFIEAIRQAKAQLDDSSTRESLLSPDSVFSGTLRAVRALIHLWEEGRKSTFEPELTDSEFSLVEKSFDRGLAYAAMMGKISFPTDKSPLPMPADAASPTAIPPAARVSKDPINPAGQNSTEGVASSDIPSAKPGFLRNRTQSNPTHIRIFSATDTAAHSTLERLPPAPLPPALDSETGTRQSPPNTSQTLASAAASPSPVPSSPAPPVPTPGESSPVKPHNPLPVVDAKGPKALSQSPVALELGVATDWTRLAWSLTAEGRLPLAYWVSWYAERDQPEAAEACPPSWLLDLAVWSARRIDPEGGTASRINDIYSRADYSALNAGGPASVAKKRLAVAASLRPALYAPFCGAANMLNTAAAGEEATIRNLAKAVVDFSRRGSALNLAPVQDESSWKSQHNDLMGRIKYWCEHANQKTTAYAPATDVWREWLKPRGPIHDLLELVRQDRRERREEVSRRIIELARGGFIEELVDRYRKQLRLKSPIIAKARNQLHRNAEEALDLAREWCDLASRAPTNNSSGRENEAFLHSLITLSEAAVVEARRSERGGEPSSRAAGAALRKTLDALLAEARGRRQEGLEGADRQRTFGLEILRMSKVRVNSLWEPFLDDLSTLKEHLITSCNQPPLSLKDAFDARLMQEDLQAAEWLLDEISRSPETAHHEGLKGRFDERLRDCLNRRHKEALITRHIVERAVLDGLVTDQERSGYLSQLEGEAFKGDGAREFKPIFDDLNRIRLGIAERTNNRIEEAKLEIKNLPCKEEDRRRIEGSLSNRDLNLANEMISLIRQSGSLPPPEPHEDVFIDFFPQAAVQIDSFLQENSTPAVLTQAIREREALPGVGAQVRTTPEQRDDAANAFSAWLRLKRRDLGQIDEDLRAILSWLELGGTTKRIQDRDRIWYDLEVSPPPHCPIPQYGSSAAGRFRVLCVWGQISVEQLLATTGGLSSRERVIALLFGRTSIDWRRDLAEKARRHGSCTVLTIDEILMLRLRDEPSRLRALFTLALPFSFSNPYTPYAAGNVPPEMFVGREKEKRELAEPLGSCFIYGGRQLGKSALLHAVKRDYDRRDRGAFAYYLDLNAEGIGEPYDPDKLWSRLHYLLKQDGIVPQSSSSITPDAISSRLQDWLREDQSRHILLLLDEADAILDKDARNNFPVVLKLRNMMSETNRRFKVVFAGLHNVQRFQAIPNQPLAHFGTPICVGPLKPTDALTLVEAPLKALGFRFADSSLSLTILSHTNYQASLIQLFCRELVQHLSQATFDWKGSPPWVITPHHIDEVYLTDRLWREIRQRFELTLNLDPRYRLLAFCAAYLTLTRPEIQKAGMTHQELFIQAKGYWSTGFKDAAEDEVRGLVDEMEGLGLFVIDSLGRYRLRSPNVLRLIGSQEQIEVELLQADEKLKPPAPSEQGTYRRSADRRDSARRSCLTTGDERELMRAGYRIKLVFSNGAIAPSGLSAAMDFLAEEEHGVVLRRFDQRIDAGDLVNRMKETLSRLDKGGRAVLYVEASALGNVPGRVHDSVKALKDSLSSRKAPDKALSVVVNFTPEQCHGWCSLPQDKLLALESGLVSVLSLKRWSEGFLHRWMEDSNFTPNTPDQGQEILAATKGWPLLMEEFWSRCHANPTRWKEALAELGLASERFANEVGLKVHASVSIALKAIKEYSGVPQNSKDAADFCSLNQDTTRATLLYLERIGVIHRERDEFKADTVAMSLLGSRL
jgi:hypothetical protein